MCPNTTQVKLTSSEVLSKNESILDGHIEFYDSYFDTKAFGFHGHLAQRLKERIAEEIKDENILIEESWDLSYEEFEKLIKSAKDIAARLRYERMVQFGHLRIRLESKRAVSVSSRIIEPYLLARENALYPFKFAKQFTRDKPFILVFIIHPWFNGNAIGRDFAGTDTQFTRSLARRAFMQFSADTTPAISICQTVHSDITLAEASRHLSAIFFVNVWPVDADPNISHPMPSWLYLNPRATHRITRGQLHCYQSINPHGTYIDDFADDNY